MNDVSKIFPGFYIGSLPAVNRNTLDKYQITHVLSILNEFQPKWTKIYKYLHIDIYDSPSVDIKKYFDKTFHFIEEGRKDGGVLVHCFAGISRSATICIAYIMRKLNISFEDAHGLLSDARPIIYPNESFIKQLKKYEFELKKIRETPQAIVDKEDSEEEEDDDDGDDEDDYDDDDEEEDSDSEESDEFDEEFDNVVKVDKKIKNVTKKLSNISISKKEITTSSISVSTLAQPILSPPTTSATESTILLETISTTATNTTTIEENENSSKSTIGQHRYCCRKCSKDLFVDFDILDHEQGQGQVSFKWGRRDHTVTAANALDSTATEDQSNKIVCTSYFINEIEFVLNQIQSGMEGKLFCPSCNEKLGSWSWSGEQCSCGSWIAPSFQIPKTRVDEKKLK